jgi:hypothetical protein
VSKEFVANVVAVGVVNELKAIKVNHEQGGAGVVELGLRDSGSQAILEEALIGKSSKVVVEGVPLVGRDLLLEQDQKHTDGDEKLLKVPDFIGHSVISRVVSDPGVEQEDKGPDDEANDDSNFAEAFAGQVELEDDRGSEIKNEEDKVSCVAKGAGRSEEPDRDPGAELDKEKPPASPDLPCTGDGERANGAEAETPRDDNMIDARIMDSEPIDRKQRNRWKRVKKQVKKRGPPRIEISARSPEKDGASDVEKVQRNNMRRKTPGPGGGIRSVDDGLKEDEEQTDKP